jgi:hypothetical protein
MKCFIILFLLFVLSSCAQTAPTIAKKHSYDTKEGKKKLQKFNDLQFGANKQFDYRIEKTTKVYKKAGYKNSSTKKKKK